MKNSFCCFFVGLITFCLFMAPLHAGDDQSSEKKAQPKSEQAKPAKKQGGAQPKQGGQKKSAGKPKQGGEKKAGGKPKQGGQKKAAGKPKQGDQKKAGGKPKQGGQKKAAGKPKQGDQKKAAGKPKQGDQKKAGGKPEQGGEKKAGGKPKPKQGSKKQAGAKAGKGKKSKKGSKSNPNAKPGALSIEVESDEIDLMELLNRTKPVYYPECKPTQIRVGLEDYQDKHMAMSGLEGVHLNVEGLIESAGKLNIKMVDNLKEKVIQRLAKAGLKLLTEEEMLITPGQPEMSMFMSFPAHLKPVKKGAKPLVYRPDCCSMGIWTSFAQAGKILRQPDTNYKLGTWGEGHNSVDCNDPGGWMSEVILKTVESFADVKIKGDEDRAELLKTREAEKPEPEVKPEPEIKVVKEEKAKVPVDCNDSVSMYIDMFATNQTYIGKPQTHALKKLAESMLACPKYNYMIETHADPRSSHAYNEKLSAMRAASIQGFLLGQGVAKERFVMQSYGELSPITLGTTDQDYAANRRVVVRPYLVDKVQAENPTE